ncbi:hypothetical protein FW774_07130 [Pedobacter sp. BS3]|uniref:hypothetical protein n=1 Tax=Pedobacter sp. BS3 TaxID=2567937 RepID=UPI0011EFF6C0|nr:hypothetical protein [Pedobacter sp. BS3]TZF84748.1 hypothetical protein FW774_07130 [Pedobacter sp. BS3]
MNCLITAASTAWAYKIKKLLNPVGNVFLGDCYTLPGISPADARFISLPKGSSESFAHRLLTLCLDLEITKVYPLREEELAPLAESALLFAEFGITVFTPDSRRLKEYKTSAAGDIVIVENGTVTTSNAIKYNHISFNGNGIFSVADACLLTIFAVPAHADLR